MTNKFENALELTQSQSLMWIGQKMHPNTPMYNMGYAFDVFGQLNAEHFKRAFKLLIEHLDVFRTQFYEEDGVPYQTLLTDFTYELEVLDFSKKGELEAQNWIKARTSKVFDLSKPLFDSALLKIDNEHYIWFLNQHHIITDATSFTIIQRKMSEIYGKVKNKDFETLPDAPSFQSFVRFEAKRNITVDVPIKNYWKENIAKVREKPSFYGIKNVKPTTAAKRISFKLGPKVSNDLKALAKQPGVRAFTEDLSMFNIFATLLFIYLYRVSGQHTVALGAPSHNRITSSFKETAGLFIEIFPLVATLNDQDTFRTVLDRVKLESNRYLRYAQPGMASADISRNISVILNYIKARFSDFDGYPLKSNWIHTDTCDPAHIMRCHVYDVDVSGDIELNFDLNEAIFNNQLFYSVPGHFTKLIIAIIEDIDQVIIRPRLVADHIVEQRIAERRMPENEFSPIIEQFEYQVKKFPFRISLQYENTTHTYDSLNRKVNRFANYLMGQGIGGGKRVALYLERSTEYIVAVLAVLKVGGTFIPISSDQPAERVVFMLKDSNCAIVVTSEKLQHHMLVKGLKSVVLNLRSKEILSQSDDFVSKRISRQEIAYILYTSGSTGKPKGVLISQAAISNYLNWAKEAYSTEQPFVFPLFTSIGFDLTITSTFMPLMTGGQVVVYKEIDHGADVLLLNVLAENKVNSIKLTPSHLALLQGSQIENSEITTVIVGGEALTNRLVLSIRKHFDKPISIYNEYGPTEATVGCIATKFDADIHLGTAVPIGKSIANMQAFVLDSFGNPVPTGVIGELFLSGVGLATGYLNLPEITDDKFIDNPFLKNSKMYRTGDLARINFDGDFEYLGRIDDQVKLRGHRIELSDIEVNLAAHPEVENCTVVLVSEEKTIPNNEVFNCVKCGLPSNYPHIDFNAHGVCQLCTAFSSYKDKVKRYFKNDAELVRILTSKRNENLTYDCIALLSGGKDSTYVLGRLIDMGLRVLAFTMDNGYISDQAKENIDRIVTKLGVDHVYGQTPHMNEIFVDSLHRHHNVCNGCFKTIYTLSTQIALEKEIPFIVTGLSRGQFFETRLTEELFWEDSTDTTKIDDTILAARKLYHREQDAVKRLLDVSAFEDDTVFEKVQFVDFYRYSDVSLEELLGYLKDKIGWVRPTDTGRSTNCLINQVGIYVHKKEDGYSNYAFPYSWDVRLGHKTRDESLAEINEVIDETEVKRIMNEIGYVKSEADQQPADKLVAYFTGNSNISVKDLQQHLAKRLPDFMVPKIFKHMDEMPLTKNGKIDKNALESLNSLQLSMDTPYTAPRNEVEELLEQVWKEVLQVKKVGVHDDFIALGGHSLAAIRVTARINEEIEVDLPLNKIFERPTIAEYAIFIEETLTELLENR